MPEQPNQTAQASATSASSLARIWLGRGRNHRHINTHDDWDGNRRCTDAGADPEGLHDARLWGRTPDAPPYGPLSGEFGYGGVFGAMLARLFPNAGLWEGLGLWVVLWLVMKIAVLPILGCGLLGTAIAPKIAVATLVFHLIYGTTLGWGLSR